MRKLTLAFALLASPALAQTPAPAPTAPDVRVPAELAQATVNYLMTRPYQEVAVLMQHWIKLAQEKKEN